MKWKAKAVAVVVFIALVSSAAYSIYSVYADNGRLSGENQTLTTQLSEKNAIITTQQARINQLAELDAKHTQRLANANAEIDRLHTASLAHPERVYIKAECPVSKTAKSSGMDDADAARPTDAAVRNYWLLRERIATSEQMMLGLQEYVRTQCG
ncbi:lysis protein [Xenorhabdus sp. XENO-10]|uniref:Lysis protein n=1 Tax=Xenorhabdus yunnanensis TaxID=3025878 RepID=A0ABT5LK17_9GAMM|nr:lysis protein [Xenorhabdus yunnanensis]MDC9591452.1 lysis protein [Xenorhabdus yunnanensis]